MRQLGLMFAAGLAACGEPPAPTDAPVTAAPDGGPTTQLPAWGPGISVEQAPSFVAAELARDPTDATVQAALAGEDPGLRARALWTTARIGRADAIEVVLATIGDRSRAPDPAEIVAAALLDPRPSAPREAPVPEAAWAVLEDDLWLRYATAESIDEARAPLLALARTGGPRTHERLAAAVAIELEAGDLARHESVLEATAILCARGHALGVAGLRAIAASLLAEPARARASAAYALGRCAGVSAERLAGEERAALVHRLAGSIASADEDEARLAWKAFAALGEVPEAIPANLLGATPPSWMVEVEAARALASHASGRAILAERLAQARPDTFAGPRLHVLLVALESLRRAVDGAPELVRALEPLSAAIEDDLGRANGRRRKELALVRCELRLLRAIVEGALDPVRACARDIDDIPSDHGEVLAVEAMVRSGRALSHEQRALGLLEAAQDIRPRVASAALSALADVDDARAAHQLRDALARADVGVVAAAATAVAARSVDRARRDPEAVGGLVDVVRRLDNATAVEARIAAVEALGNLGRSAPPTAPLGALGEVVLPLATDPNAAVRNAARVALLGQPSLLARFDAAIPPVFVDGFGPRVAAAVDQEPATGLRVQTDLGPIDIAFAGAPAPIAHATLIALARAGAFDGLTFHRVVPGFVVQGGDPRGDGYGGPGYVLPCEWSNMRYERGTVGIALAGKDTGGSQFFVTHSRQPHLDARFTVVGHVTSGMEVIDALLPFDAIDRVEVLP